MTAQRRNNNLPKLPGLQKDNRNTRNCFTDPTKGVNLDHFVILELSSLRLIPHHAKIFPARQSVASSCALILIVTQDCADIHCDFAFCFFNHLGCCKGIVFIINHYNESPINIMLKNNVIQFGIASISRSRFMRGIPWNYRLSKIHFRVFALVKAFKFNLSSMIFRNSMFSSSIISIYKDLREIFSRSVCRNASHLSPEPSIESLHLY